MKAVFIKYFLVSLCVLHGQSTIQTTNLVDILTQIRFQNVVLPFDGRINDTCQNHASIYFKNLKNGIIWALKMFDSSTKIPESLLVGQRAHLGNFDECLDMGIVDTGNGTFSGKYCLATLGTTSSKRQFHEVRNGSAETANIFLRVQERAGNGTRDALLKQLSGVQMAQCIPSTCSGEEYQNIINGLIEDNIPELQLAMVFTDDMCQTVKIKDLAAEDWVTVGILIVILILSVGSTAYDLLKTENKNETLTAFSWYSNGKKILATSSSGDTLGAVHGIRFISMTWVVMGHRYVFTEYIPVSNINIVPDIVTNFWRLYLTNAPLSVDTFLFLSGLLVTYVFLKHMDKTKAAFNVPMYYFHRYIRLTPAYAMVILLQATLVRYMASGPLYGATMNGLADNCQKYWWTSILYINNYYKAGNNCIPQSWYLAVDMQLFILSPIILYPLWKWPKKWSLCLLGSLVMAGIITAFTVSFVDENPANYFITTEEQVELQYYPTHTRFSPWIIGAVFGYIIFKMKKEHSKVSLKMVLLGWVIGAAGLLGSLLGAYRFIYYSKMNPDASPGDYPGNFENSIYTALSRPAWALGVGWMTFTCVFGYGGPINTFLSWKLFQPLSRLTYCVYLVHTTYQYIRYLSARTPGYVSDIVIVPDFFSDVLSCLIIAAILSLCTEAPIIILEKQLFERGHGSKNRDKPLTTTIENTNAEKETTVDMKEEETP